jgi:hypothetical protein
MAANAQRIGAPWRLQLQRDADGEVLPVLHNLITILENTYANFDKPLTDHEITGLRCNLSREWRASWSYNDVADAVDYLRRRGR